jgi:excisionase family DNA binding protein
MNTLAEAGKYLSIGKHAVYNAIKKKRLKAVKKDRRWNFNTEDLDAYKKEKFDRKFSTFKGKPLYDKSKGEHSLIEAAKILGCPRQHLYYACKENKIPTTKKKSVWVINIKDIEAYRNMMHIRRRKNKK